MKALQRYSVLLLCELSNSGCTRIHPLPGLFIVVVFYDTTPQVLGSPVIYASFKPLSLFLGADALDSRTRNSTVRFRKAFAVSGLGGMQPPGLYHLQRYEILLDTISAPAYRHVSTTIELHDQPAGVIRTATVDPLELEDALARDGALTDAGACSDPATSAEVQNDGLANMHKARLGAASVRRDTHAADSVSRRDGGRNLDAWWKASLRSLHQWAWMNTRELVWSVITIGGAVVLSLIL